MYQLGLQGRAYESDNNTVFHLIQLAVLQTPAHTWIEDVIPTRDGRGAMTRLRNYYEGPANLHTRQQIAMQVIDNLTYTNERTMTFEAMITKLTKAYNTLSKQGQHYVDNVKVDALAKRIKMPGNHTVGYALENMRTAYRNDFPGACQFLKSRMAEINASQQNASAGHRRISNVVKNPANWNGVDISNPFRNFTAEEWDKLGPRGQKLTFDLRKQDGNRKRPAAGRGSGRGYNPRGRGRGAGGRYNTNRGTNTNNSDNTRQVNETNTNERSNHSKPPILEVSTGGSVASVSQVSTASSERGSQNGTRSISAVHTGPRSRPHKVKRLKTVGDTDRAGTIARCELDTRADTTCAGINCRPIFFTGQTCAVSAFHADLDTISNIPIASVATVWTDNHTGIGFVLILNEVLYFGDSLDHSLINPNQIRSFGIPVQDNPYDMSPHKKDLGIHYDPDTIIPFYTNGATIYMETHFPSDDELDSLPHLVLTSDTPWDPAALVMPGSKSGSGDSDERLIHAIQRTLTSSGEDVCDSAHSIVMNVDGDTAFMTNFAMCQHTVNVKAASSTSRHSMFTPEHISKVFNIGLGKAKSVLLATTQRGVRHAVRPLHRRYRVDHLHLHRNDLGGRWTLDHLESKVTSLRGHTGAFVITNGSLVMAYPCATKNADDAAESLRRFCEEVGVPVNLKSDLAASFTGRHTPFMVTTRKYGINLTYSEKDRHNQLQQVDLAIRDLKRRWHHVMTSRAVPRRLWCYGIEHQARVMNLIPRGREDRTGYEVITGQTPDISEYIDFGFYDLVWYWRGVHPSLTDHTRELARWVGVAHRVGSDMCYWLIPVSGIPIASTTVQHVTAEEMRDEDLRPRIDDFNKALTARLDCTNFQLNADVEYDYPLDIYDQSIDKGDPTEQTDDVDDIESFDNLVGATFLLDPVNHPENGGSKARVVRRRVDANGVPIGKAHPNPLLDTREYEVELEDGTFDSYFANVIAENLWMQCDPEGRETQVFHDIIDHRSNNRAIRKEDGFTYANGRSTPKITTAGWDLLVEFADGSTNWIPLKLVKNSNPVELADYASANRLLDEPAFAWWAPKVLRRRKRLISKVKKKYWRQTHKFGIRLPKTVQEALRLDEENGNTLWADAIKKEMSKAKVSYMPVENCTPEMARTGKCDALRGFQEIKCHIIFDVKMDFTRKARFVAGGHMTEAPSSMTYSSVVSRDSVKIAFLIAALNGLEVMTCDIGNAYLNAPCRERIWFLAGAECGEYSGMVCKLVRALYGLKSSGAAWRAMFSSFIVNQLGFSPTKADPDVYIRAQKNSQGWPYYEYLLVYVDDVLVVSHNPTSIMQIIGTEFEIKNNDYGPPTVYLGAGISKYQLRTGQEAWSMDSQSYVKEAVRTVRDLLNEDDRDLKTCKRRTHSGPLPHNYQPELDTTPFCDEDKASRYRQIIGIYRWAIELGRIDIHLEVALMSQYQAQPRVGHLEALYLIANYLHLNPLRRIVFDPTTPEIDETAFNEPQDWRDFYGDVIEEDPPGMPTPLGNPVTMACFVDSDHAGNKVTRRSHTGIIIFLQNAPIMTFSKKQNTCESSTYGSELVAMRIARDLISALRIKLKWFGIPITGATNVYCDNNSVVKNVSLPESTLAKKHNAVNYHIIRESVAAGIIRVAKEDTETNIADAFTKLMPNSRKLFLLSGILLNK